MTRVAINGFGRIGRLVARTILEQPEDGLEFVGVNDLAEPGASAWLSKHDSGHGLYRGEVSADADYSVIDGRRIRVTAENLPPRARLHRAGPTWGTA